MKLKTLGNATLKALIKNKNILSKNVKVKTKRKYNKSQIYLTNATTYEQNIFSDCISQMLGKINQPRYLIAKPKIVYPTEFYVVPELFKKNKATVTLFTKCLVRKIGAFSIIFGKNDAGKNKVIKASKLYYFKYKKVDIETKNILLSKKIKR